VKVLVEGSALINTIGMLMSAFPVPSMLSWTIDKDHRTALHDSSANGHTEVVQFLVAQYANVNAVGLFCS
jgi:hypothetical protein